MRFNLVDRILELEPGRQIRVAKNLSLGEEYLADHFPTFPVMPGVLMLETLVEAGAWLLRVTEDFRHSVIVLREARNVKFGHFMEPGRQMVATAEFTSVNDTSAEFKAKAEADGHQTVSARICLARYNLIDRDPGLADADRQLTLHWKRLYALLAGNPRPAVATAT